MTRTLSFRIKGEDVDRIEAVIKTEYPKLKTYTDVIRCALKEYLDAWEQCEAKVEP